MLYHISRNRGCPPLDLRDDGDALRAVRVTAVNLAGGRWRLEERLGDLDAALGRERRQIRAQQRLGDLKARVWHEGVRVPLGLDLDLDLNIIS